MAASSTWIWVAAGAVGAWVLWPRSKSSTASSKPVLAPPVAPKFTAEQQKTFAAALPSGTTYDEYMDAALKATGKDHVNYGNVFPPVSPMFTTIYRHQFKTWSARALPLAAQLTKDGGDYGQPGTNGPIFTELYKQPFVPVLVPLLQAPGSQIQIGANSYNIKGWEWGDRNFYGNSPATAAGGGIDVLAIISMAGNYTLPLIPGYGTAANAALQATVALGQGKSLDEAALAGARGALPPWGQVAFDLGVGVAIQKKKPDQAALDAALNALDQKYPGAKQAYVQGLAMVKKNNVSGGTSGVAYCYAALV